jgi:hypothetical protein
VRASVRSDEALPKWWSAGFEMTLAGLIVGGATYALGLALKVSGG